MPDWKRDVGRRLDALTARTVPGVRKAVKWNSPFYGGEGRLVPVRPRVHPLRQGDVPPRHVAAPRSSPGGTGKEARWIDIHEDDLDEVQIAAWIRQAAALPGWGS